jgi:hypothetical protein
MTQKRVLQISLDPAPQRRLCGSKVAAAATIENGEIIK